MQRYLVAASLATTQASADSALISAWICRERMFRRESALEVGENVTPPRRADGHLGAIGE